MNIIFVPVYISYVGIESYGLIGLFASLQTWLALLDLGLSPTLNREMARLRGGVHTPESIRDLLQSVQILYWTSGILVALAIWFFSPWLASHWLRAPEIAPSIVIEALSISGLVIALRWIGGLYKSALGGLQQQVWLNASGITFSTLRGIGSIAILAFVSASIQAFFVFQAAVALIETITLFTILRALLPPSDRAGRFSLGSLSSIWRFAAGVTAITFSSLLLTQVDKLLLPTIITLSALGYYVLANVVTGGISAVISPILSVVGPRFSELVARGDDEAINHAFHRYTQLLALILAPISGIAVLFGGEVLLLWTGSSETAEATAPILSLLSLGTLLNGLAIAPFSLQLAYGRTRFIAAVNSVGAVVMIPTVFLLAYRWGAVGAAFAPVLVNLLYMFAAMPLLQSRYRMPIGTLREWYLRDLLPPGLAVVAVLVPLRLIAERIGLMSGIVENAALVAAAASLAFGAAAVGTPMGREFIARSLKAARALARRLGQPTI